MKNLSNIFKVALCALLAVNAWAAETTNTEDATGNAFVDSFDAVVVSVNNGDSNTIILDNADNFVTKAQERFEELKSKFSIEQQQAIQDKLNEFKSLIALARQRGDFSLTNLQRIGQSLRDFKTTGIGLWPMNRRGRTVNPNDANETQELLNSVNNNNPNTDLLNPTSDVTSPTAG